ncbi:deoxycytidylate deaminase [Hamiltosporidium tvaerminnensis]|uniref:dCMP deaminase n=2 Tax=Hamiltosporidium TaxID=1176354 RepID=A0A4Q9LDW7_9MICR|nr:Deoxycytidine monophosphate (dCMP) deaminase [Hamiltosporidium tvaerminnensis]TBU03490.1 deoxycytidylate deaminase [Hamiltosporidium tvaerminnensis]TBU06128.1 deoxycytidylate deaminase [Hamiltosporidium magnivora]
MLLCILGPKKSGKHAFTNYLCNLSYTYIDYSPDLSSTLICESKWNKSLVTILPDPESWLNLRKRPFVHLIIIYAPSKSIWRNSNDDSFFLKVLNLKLDKSITQCTEIPNYSTIESLFSFVSTLDFNIRPTFDKYFMDVAVSVSLRSNCMKMKIGAIIVKDKRIIATGYNGTPKSMLNCFEGGCNRCNSNVGNNKGLTYCVCIHAEESALLNIGYERCVNSYIYVTHFPCQLCFRKIVQMGIKKVLYRFKYSLEDDIVNDYFKSSDIETESI